MRGLTRRQKQAWQASQSPSSSSHTVSHDYSTQLDVAEISPLHSLSFLAVTPLWPASSRIHGLDFLRSLSGHASLGRYQTPRDSLQMDPFMFKRNCATHLVFYTSPWTPKGIWPHPLIVASVVEQHTRIWTIAAVAQAP